MSQCSHPPAGWTCSRGADHEGPCAVSMSDTEEVRVLLIKKGDVLLIGGVDVGEQHQEEVMGALSAFKDLTGIRAVALFLDDIDIAGLTADQLRGLLAEAEGA